MNTCGTCRYFGDPLTVNRCNMGYRQCAYILHYEGKLREGPAQKHAYTIDSSDYYATLCVAEDFGCNLWEKAK